MFTRRSSWSLSPNDGSKKAYRDEEDSYGMWSKSSYNKEYHSPSKEQETSKYEPGP